MRLLKKIAILSSLTISASLFSGCVTTTHALSTEQCQKANWKEIGYTDGTVGRSGAYFGNHQKSCSAVAENQPNRILWEQGRQEGLKEFCTELTAYKLGREGLAWRPVCPLEGIEKLEEAYNEGRYYYLRERDLDYLSDPYRWGYGPYGYPHNRWHHPFWHPYW